jgi:hypothetical protein
MRKLLPVLLILAASSAWAAPRFAGDGRMEILVNGVPRPVYAARGETYIEALKNQGYEIRLTNPYGVRVAVALSVDGLNTLDARHTDARSARKWVLEPYQTIVLRGWQTSSDEARRFFFTSEEKSYGQWLGKTENLGVISAAFFRERVPMALRETAPAAAGIGGARDRRAAPNTEDSPAKSAPAVKQQEEYAATGIGSAESHPVVNVHLDLEDSPASVVSVRYEYHSALVALGVIPESPVAEPLHRREKARGFTDGYCPSPR